MTTIPNTCLYQLLLETDDKAFGFKMQAVAAHILLRLGHNVEAVNHNGHPDIVTFKDGVEYRFEVEAEVHSHRKRILEPADIVELTASDGIGYFALVVSFPRPYWIVVPVLELVTRDRPYGNATLEALSDESLSDAWTQEHLDLLTNSCTQLRERSYRQLVRRAVEGRVL